MLVPPDQLPREPCGPQYCERSATIGTPIERPELSFAQLGHGRLTLMGRGQARQSSRRDNVGAGITLDRMVRFSGAGDGCPRAERRELLRAADAGVAVDQGAPARSRRLVVRLRQRSGAAIPILERSAPIAVGGHRQSGNAVRRAAAPPRACRRGRALGFTTCVVCVMRAVSCGTRAHVGGDAPGIDEQHVGRKIFQFEPRRVPLRGRIRHARRRMPALALARGVEIRRALRRNRRVASR